MRGFKIEEKRASRKEGGLQKKRDGFKKRVTALETKKEGGIEKRKKEGGY